MTIAVSVEELQRAWAAVASGEFRSRNSPARRDRGSWSPRGRVLAVVGATGRVGATSVALAVAEAAHVPARVIECPPVHASGLTAAAQAELGINATGWRKGIRDGVVIERSPIGVHTVESLPVPDDSDYELSI